ncbi:hypothetical protein L7F22_065336 [Adiantum nelumboides]|nr:hypothetical protein [Adiantum nelumboides]
MLGTLDLSYNQLTGSLPSSIGKLSQLIDLSLAGNSLSGAIPQEVGHLQKLTKLDLSRNMLSGTIPSDLGDCSSLTMLDLSHNHLSGSIPTHLSKLFILDSLSVSWNRLSGSIPPTLNTINTLTTVDFSFNNLSGSIPLGGKFSSFNGSSFLGNPGLCGKQVHRECSYVCSSSTAKIKQQKVIISICCILVGLSCIAVAIAWCLRKIEVGMGWELIAFEKLAFTAKDVVQCVAVENVISKGRSAIVYKGLILSKQVIAIKALLTRGDDGFAAEIRTLGCIRHRNIVRLLGYCTNKDTSFLLLEYMPNGSLANLLHGPQGGLLDWKLRYQIALDAAKGLCYLHHDHSPMIVHRDVKSSNILLDKNFEAHVADFGLAKVLHNVGASESMSSIAGSYGYIAPEYAYTLRVDEKSDVYSYGVVLLELITGRRPIEPEYGDYIDIARWVKQKARTREERMEIWDARVCTSNADDGFMLLLQVALMCVSNQPEHRPTMQNVVRLLADGCRARESPYYEELKGSKQLDV